MTPASSQAYDYDADEALREIKAERTRRSWIALILFVLATVGVGASLYFSYRDIPAPASPANNTPRFANPYH